MSNAVHAAQMLASSQPAAPHASRFITLEAWVDRTYGDAVSIATARRWVREGRIYPAPQKHGRAYFVAPDARYTDPSKPVKLRLIDRIHGAATA